MFDEYNIHILHYFFDCFCNNRLYNQCIWESAFFLIYLNAKPTFEYKHTILKEYTILFAGLCALLFISKLRQLGSHFWVKTVFKGLLKTAVQPLLINK